MHLAEATIGFAPGADAALGPIRQLVTALDGRGIRYCHWKGNVRLAAAVRGEKDFDLLIDATQATAVAGVLAEIGFRRLVERAGRGFPGIDHHLGFDSARGALVHLHLHTQLIPTKGNPGAVRLPWEELVLATRMRDARYDIDVPSPELELLMFVVRAALRVSAKHQLAERLGRPFFDASGRDELRWLQSRADLDQFELRARALIGEAAARVAASIVRGDASARSFVAIRRQMDPAPRELRAYSGTESLGARLRSRSGGKRTLSAGGRIIVFLGSDGAGKSTVVRALTAWLGAELDVRPVYFGSGDGASSLLRRSLRLVDRVRRALTPGRPRGAGLAPETLTPEYLRGERYVAGVEPGLRAAWKIASKLSLAREKRARLTAAMRWRTRGAVVICDRYPQTQQPGFNDGPLLSPWSAHPSPLLRGAASREFAAYRAAAALPPDLVIKLVVSPEVAASRKDDMSLELLRTRGAAIRTLRFPAGARVVEIDADQPLDVVLAMAQRAIWEAL